METISYTALRNKLSGMIDQVNENHTPVIITRQNGTHAVLMSLEDFRSYEATAYLMASPKNMQRLNESITEIEAGKAIPNNLIES
jgi:antitoxin YefM